MIAHPRILILDDEEGPRSAIQIILGREGMECSVAASSDEALALAAHTRFDLLVTDLSHPGLDGLDLLPVWRQLHPHAPVVIISARLDCERAGERALQLGAAVCVNKPFTVQQVRAAVQIGLAAGSPARMDKQWRN